MSELEIYRCTPRQTRAFMIDIIKAGRVPFVRSSPGMGKSALYRSVAREFNLWLIDHRLSTSTPEDLSGLPEFYTDDNGIRRARFVPFDMFPVAGTPIPEGYEGWLLFLDEANSGTKMVQAASYKLILDNMVGQYPLHERVAMGLAGNLDTDRAITTALSTALQRRVIHIELMLDHQQWLEDVALANHYDERIIAYNMFDKDALMDFQPDHQDKTFCCPATWEFMNDLLKVNPEVSDDRTPLFAGTITSGHAAQFVQFCQVYKFLSTINDIIANPTGVRIPEDHRERWALITKLMRQVDQENIEKVTQYINRMDMTFKILFYRGVLAKTPEFRRHPAIARGMIEVIQHLKED